MMGEGGWIFLPPFEGLEVFVADTGERLRYGASGWQAAAHRGPVEDGNGDQVVGMRQVAIMAPSGGGTQDRQARAAIGEIIAALEAHGLVATA